nr:MAG TPA: hypothetical protein [Caudoviricetes sp.]
MGELSQIGMFSCYPCVYHICPLLQHKSTAIGILSPVINGAYSSLFVG